MWKDLRTYVRRTSTHRVPMRLSPYITLLCKHWHFCAKPCCFTSPCY